MSEYRSETSTAGSLVVLIILLGGLALLGIAVVVGLGFIVSRTTVERVAMAEREEAMLQRELAEQQMQRAMMANQERLRQMAEDGQTLRGQPAEPVQMDQLAKARDVADKYVDLWSKQQLKDANNLLMPDLQAEAGGPGGAPLVGLAPPVKPAVLTSLRAGAKQFRFRYHAELPGEETTDFVIAVVQHEDGYRIKTIDFDAVPAGGAGMANP